MRTRFCTVIAALLLLTACSGAPQPDVEGPPTDPEREVAKTPEEPEPLLPVAERVRWFSELIAGGDLSEEEYRAIFSAEFVDMVPLADFMAGVEAKRAEGPFGELCRREKGERSEVYFTGSETGFHIKVVVAAEAPHQIIGFRISDSPWARTDLVGDWPTLVAELKALGPDVSLLATELGPEVEGPTKLVDLVAHNADAQLGVGSAFKLWVLAALQDEVARGLRSWTDEVVLEDRARSLSSLEIGPVEAGTSLTLETLATAMISISDNTATDILIDTLGREPVEAMLSQTHHSAAARNIPFLTTRDLFWLKLQLTAEERAQYIADDTATRRGKLEKGEFDLGVASWKAMGWGAPIDIEELEWFASARDLAQVMAHHRDRMVASDEVRNTMMGILGKNAGLPSCGDWRFVGFKGGSEPGVMNLTWLLVRNDDRVFVLALTVNNPDALLDEAAIMNLAFAARRLIASAP